jgi:hypothetical protein
VRAAIGRLAAAGLDVEDVSVPWHLDAMHVWNVIATEGATAQMIDGNAYGMNWKGLYDPELIAHYGRQWRERSAQFSETVKLVVLAGRLRDRRVLRAALRDGRNLRSSLRRPTTTRCPAHDVLVMPTLPITAPRWSSPARRARSTSSGAGDDLNTAPFDVTGPPGDLGAGGLVDGLPAGLMIVGGTSTTPPACGWPPLSSGRRWVRRAAGRRGRARLTRAWPATFSSGSPFAILGRDDLRRIDARHRVAPLRARQHRIRDLRRSAVGPVARVTSSCWRCCASEAHQQGGLA